MKKFTYFLLLSLWAFACEAPNEGQQEEALPTAEEAESAPAPEIPEFVAKLETAHQKDVFDQKKAVSFDIELFFGGKKRLEGTVVSLTNSSKVRLEKKDGTVLLYDGEKVFIQPDSSMYPGARFDMFTWAYFFMAPFKFSDPGAQWEEKGELSLQDKAYPTARLTFSSEVGDTPDDWYIAYRDPESDLLYALAYIVTFGTTTEKANEEPHAITYHDYAEMDGIPVAQEWKFWQWSEAEGISEEIGRATLSNISFMEPEADFFEMTGEDMSQVSLPQ